MIFLLVIGWNKRSIVIIDNWWDIIVGSPGIVFLGNNDLQVVKLMLVFWRHVEGYIVFLHERVSDIPRVLVALEASEDFHVAGVIVEAHGLSSDKQIFNI
jgi:hypothetical protein